MHTEAWGEEVEDSVARRNETWKTVWSILVNLSDRNPGGEVTLDQAS